MKLRELIEILQPSPKGESGIIAKVFNAMPDESFERKIEMAAPYKELESIYTMYEEQRLNNVKEMQEKYLNSDKVSEKDKGKSPADLGRVPEIMIPEFKERMEKLWEKEIKIKPFTFNAAEIRAAKLKIPDILELDKLGFVSISEIKKELKASKKGK